MKKAILLFIIVLLHGATQLSAQNQVIFQDNNPKTYAFRFNGGGASNGEVNYIITRLAESYGRGNYNIEYQLGFNQSARITKAGNQLTLTVDFQNIVCSGDIFYKAFNVGDVLIPSNLSFQVNLLNNQNQVVSNYNFDNVKIINGIADGGQATYKDSTNGTFKLQVVNLKLTYSKNAIQQFDDRIAAINDYNFSLSQLDINYQNLQVINLNDIDNIPNQNSTLQLIESNIAGIESKNIPQRLNLMAFDPGQFMMKFGSLKDQAFQKRMAMNQILSTLDANFYNKGLEFLVNGNGKAARNYFNRSTEVNPAFAPANYQLAKMDFVEGNLQDAENRAKDILYKMNPDPNTKQLTQELLHNVFVEYVNQATEFNRKGMYNNALNLLQRAVAICKGMSGVVCDEKVFTEMNIAKKGIYESYLTDAKMFLQKNDLDKAEKAVYDAVTYQKNNDRELPDHLAADAVMKSIKQQRYNNFVSDSKIKIAQRDFSGALNNLNSATDLQREYNLTPIAEINKLKKEAAKPVVFILVNDGLENVRSNQLQNARKIAKEAAEIQNNNGLADDKEVIKSLKSLQDKIFSQQCINAQNAFDNFVNKALQAAAKNEYINADNFYIDAERVMSDNAECALKIGTTKDDHLKLLPAATYQKLIYQTIDLQDNSNYQQAIDKYLEAGKYFINFEIQNFKLEHKDLYNFTVSNGKNGFLAFVAEYYKEKKELDKSLDLYKELIKRNYPERRYKRPVYELGREFAKRDFAKNSKADFKKVSTAYANGMPELKYLTKGYRYQWRKLN